MDQQINPDAALGVQFFVDAVENPRKSKEAGRPIYEDREFIRIAFPGDNKKSHVAPAHELHYVGPAKRQMTYAERFNASYEAFKRGQADYQAGTPIDIFPGLTPSQRQELKSQQIRTVEQLAGLRDAVITKLGPGWRQRVTDAKAFLSRSKSTAEVDALRAELAELKAMLSGRAEAPAAEAEPVADDPIDASAFADYEEEDLRNMALDAGLNPHPNAKRTALTRMLVEEAQRKAKVAA